MNQNICRNCGYKFLKKLVNTQSNVDSCYFDKLLWKIWNIALWYERKSN